MAGKEVTLLSQNKGESLNKATWIFLRATGFSSEEEARQFGNRLRSVVQLSALSLLLGVDVGDDKPTATVDEQAARSMGLIKEHERSAPNVHGLMILPDDEKTRFPVVNIEVKRTVDVGPLLSALKESGEENGNIEFGRATDGVRVLNLALMTSEPLAQMVLAFSAVEELGQNEKWSDAQRALIEQLAKAVEASTEANEAERAEVAEAIRTSLFRIGLRQGVKRVLSSVGLDDLLKEWDRLYRIRSGLFHGTARPSDIEIKNAARETVILCGRIILAMVAKQGVRVPSIAETHFAAAGSTER
jgi:hypothetical protein